MAAMIFCLAAWFVVLIAVNASGVSSPLVEGFAITFPSPGVNGSCSMLDHGC